MESLFPYLLWGGLFFLMMRFGCGSHMFGHRRGDQAGSGRDSHGGRHAHGCCGPAPDTMTESPEVPPAHRLLPTEHRDPVCGKSIATDTAKTSVHGGTVHYFCSRDCREVFEAAPEAYLSDDAKALTRSTVPLIDRHPRGDHRDNHSTHR